MTLEENFHLLKNHFLSLRDKEGPTLFHTASQTFHGGDDSTLRTEIFALRDYEDGDERDYRERLEQCLHDIDKTLNARNWIKITLTDQTLYLIAIIAA